MWRVALPAEPIPLILVLPVTSGLCLVAHGISMMTLGVGAGRMVMEKDPARARTAGLRVDMAEDDSPAEIGLALELSVYRIVQEALGGASGRGRARSAHVALRWEPGLLEVVVRDDGQEGAPAAPDHRLVRMRERAALFGGTLDAVAVPGGGFEVRARLPTAGEGPSSKTSSVETPGFGPGEETRHGAARFKSNMRAIFS
ncbi:signal transduction histidine kinase [Streptosporangium album]|uniref:histidine kinase n=1 Tax=Streptosporangium album TaxID=47479 RepID=A0A7W7RZT4_9ACTN|nr:hypothetical protein [Streptosporangium album]MBB4941289.1 signal transduction histidine kinase [Streptosporangium album]